MGCLIGKAFINSNQQYHQHHDSTLSIAATDDTATVVQKTNPTDTVEVINSSASAITAATTASKTEEIKEDIVTTTTPPPAAEISEAITKQAEPADNISIVSDDSVLHMYRTRVFGTSCENFDDDRILGPEIVFQTVEDRYTIDTSRAKSNKPVVSLCAQKLGLQEYSNGRSPMEPCDIYWHSVVYSDLKYVVTNANSRVNKFPGMTELAKKVALTRAILSMKKLFNKEYEFYPNSWFIPAQFNDFVQHCDTVLQRKSTDTANQLWYIVKPDDGAQGTGIYLIQSPDDIKDCCSRQLIQEYIGDPLLLSDRLKFDLRVYAVIKSINPLSIYVAREGMVRFCTEKYVRPTRENAKNLYAHLTNYSLNKSNQSYVHSFSLADQMRASKRLLSSVFYQLELNGVNVRQLWHNIKIIIVKTILAMVPEIMLNYEHYFCDSPGPQCFQIIGFDILIREDETPILLEVNSAPSLTVDHCVTPPNSSPDTDPSDAPKIRSVVDEAIKIPLVRDTILLVLDLLDKDCSARTLNDILGALTDNANCAEKVLQDPYRSRCCRRSYLTEIFPNRYRQNSGHLLFLDKAMYLFMQFINIKLTTAMTLSGVRSFIRKCNLSDVISLVEVELKFRDIYINYTGEQEFQTTSGLPFHAFLQLLYDIAELKFPEYDTLLEKVQELLTFCDLSLRHYGIRSARLRRTEIDRSDKENCVEIYLLPSRLAERRAGREAKRRRTCERLPQRQRYGHSLPRAINISQDSSHETNQQLSATKVKNKALLPKLRPPFVFGLH